VNIPRSVQLGILGGIAWFGAGIFVGWLIWG